MEDLTKIIFALVFYTETWSEIELGYRANCAVLKTESLWHTTGDGTKLGYDCRKSHQGGLIIGPVRPLPTFNSSEMTSS